MIKDKLRKEFLNKFSNSNFVGVEIEMPLINLKAPYQINNLVIQKLFINFINLDFKIIDKDNENNIIAIKNTNGDTISLEYSLNTLEFSLSKELNIYNLEKKFLKYYYYTQTFLEKYDYKLCDVGINPNYKNINRACLNQNRYKVIEKLLTNKEKNLYSEFCSYCCSIQTHINVDLNRLVNVLNMFTEIEDLKGEIFANSYMDETKINNSRKYLWENSNFGPNNVGKNKIYNSIEDIIENYMNRDLFFIKRNNKYLLLKEKIILKDYFIKEKIVALDDNNKEIIIKPDIKDFENFRSYKSVELTRYGTLEIRTDCTQNLDKIFKLIAFNVGVSVVSDDIFVNDTIEMYKKGKI